ncbi:16S rRNA (cytosine(1402)-N(4))-methyltransferase RsmH [Caldicoprobacter algeriensis]|uniref:16S rRNA (cytosine(1402)-N(4))-methyltransferase RsmH n=1 Tax=Caldicoprobacter algeriensis TaxID=699281 RepID=UPI002079D61F|nr:16S rRNA (cytosine(1402)-N(4))-methyltransferase RsmH [Caldicoprobacter algeriensis]MCM8899872.1 16S rRNA (cytosine(1402)-N(4))-methyltransferase RsmH [Caldicoprobacter algeriensis]
MEFSHTPVLLDEVLKLLDCHPGQVIVDGTVGGGGHAYEILKRIIPGGFLIGIDRDPNALEAAQKKLEEFEGCFKLVHANFANVKEVLKSLGIDAVDGMLLDLGVSSYQLEERARGFTYMQDAPLDMRMDPTQTFSAYNVVNEYSQQELERVIREYGEERWAKRIAEFIVSSRPIETTGQLVDVIKRAIPAAARREGPHPAKRTFQAIRIEVNQELNLLPRAIESAVEVLKPGGRLCIISFHSLEDRIVKQMFRSLSNPCTCPPDSPVCICGRRPLVKLLTSKPVTPTSREVSANPRSRSAKARCCQKL